MVSDKTMKNNTAISFGNIYKGKKVLITGNTGFKGSWLSLWLLQLEAEVYGISIDIPTNPSLFETLGLADKIQHHFADINDLERIKSLIADIAPDFVFHLAAQPIVAAAYLNPVETFKTNVLGTANVLEALRIWNHPCTAVIISSDKCYENEEWAWSYRETDHLGGKDPYSASKGACEIIIHSYFHSYFKSENSNIRLVSARAGNVIGGGDWAEKRLIPDCIKAWADGASVEIRNPASTRPWQHVLEPLSGYLRAAEMLHQNYAINGEPFNFGPPADDAHTVLDVLTALSQSWNSVEEKIHFKINDKTSFHEAGFLKLNCDKALAQLQWKPVLEYNKTIQFTADWYKAYYNNQEDIYQLSMRQLNEYCSIAALKELAWTRAAIS